jgi:hypothetical protein
VNIKRDQNLISFLKSLDLSSLELSSELIQNVTQAGVTFFEALGKIRQKMLKKELKRQVDVLDKVLEKEVKNVSSKETTLFPNRIPSEAFAISSKISDAHTQLLNMNVNDLVNYYEGRCCAVYVNNKQITFKHQSIDTSGYMGSRQEFIEIMGKWMDPKTLQHWCALWNWCCENKSFFFPYVPINDILATVYTIPKDGQFKMGERRSFSNSLNFFHNATIELPVVIETLLPTGKKKKEEAIRMFRLLNLDLAKKNKKGDVYLKIAGEILPGFNPGKYRGRIFPKGIFLLDANREGNRITLAYRICNRFDQMNGSQVHWPLEDLIVAAGLESTYKNNRSDGCIKLTRTLQRFVEVKCIDGFEPKKITATLTKPITLYSPNF